MKYSSMLCFHNTPPHRTTKDHIRPCLNLFFFAASGALMTLNLSCKGTYLRNWDHIGGYMCHDWEEAELLETLIKYLGMFVQTNPTAPQTTT